MSSVREEGMISKETGVPIENYKMATKNHISLTLINLTKLIKEIIMIQFNIMIEYYIKVDH